VTDRHSQDLDFFWIHRANAKAHRRWASLCEGLHFLRMTGLGGLLSRTSGIPPYPSVLSQTEL
jgi:hypothetical protein